MQHTSRRRFVRSSVALSLALAVAPAAAQQAQSGTQAPISEHARELARQGLAQLLLNTRPADARARELFSQAYAESPHWQILFNLGTASKRLERFGEAQDAFERVLATPGLDSKRAGEVRQQLNEIQFSRADVSLETQEDETYWVIDERQEAGAEPLVNRYGPFTPGSEPVHLAVHQGQHTFRLVRQSDGQQQPWSVTLAPGASVSHAFASLSPQELELQSTWNEVQPLGGQVTDETPRHPYRTTGAVLLGTGAAATAFTVAALLRANSARSSADERFASRCPAGAIRGSTICAPDYGLQKVDDWRTAALVSSGVGLAALASGAVLFWKKADSAESDRGVARARLELSPFGVQVSGSF